MLAQTANWDVFVIPTPHAVPFLDVPLLTSLTGHQVRSDYRSPETAESFPPCNAIVVVAATFNTTNKFALAIADNRALTILCENLGCGLPILLVPCVNSEPPRSPSSFFEESHYTSRMGSQRPL